MPVTICKNTIRPAIDQRRPAPNGRTVIPAWRWLWLLFFLSAALLCVDASTAVPGNQAMPWGFPAVRHGQDVCFHYCDYCGIVLSRSNPSCFDMPAGPNPTLTRWAWMVPVESESPDTDLVQGKITIIRGLHPSGIACHGYVPCLPKRIFRRLYLQKKALLC
jgi:hypothetical protein